MMPIKAVILSHAFLGDGMCIVVGLLATRGLVIARLLNQQGDSLTYRSLRLDPNTVRREWRFGREISIGRIGQENPRPTHPEDHRVIPHQIDLGERVWSWAELEPRLAHTTYDRLVHLFPVVVGQSYVAKRSLDRSVGYVRGASIEIAPTNNNGYRADLIDRTGHRVASIPTKGASLNEVLRHHFRSQGNRAYCVHNATVCLALSTPWSPGHGSQKCFLEVLDVHETPF